MEQGSNTHTVSNSTSKILHGSLRCRTARGMALAIGIVCILWMLSLPVVWALSHSSESIPFLLPLWSIPFLLGLVAWSRHLLGGAMIAVCGALLSLASILSFRNVGMTHDFLALTSLGGVMIAAGLLHLAAWQIERGPEKTG